MRNRKNNELFRKAQQFDKEYDYFNDAKDIKDYQIALEDRYDSPAIMMDEDVAQEYLADNLEEEDNEILMQDHKVDEEEPISVSEPESEIDEDVPDFGTTEEAMRWAIDNNKLVKIFYITSGKSKSKGGIYLKRERGFGGGARIYRIVEPHYLFQAKNRNLILVTYDRSVGHIRAFIISNIIDYNFIDKNFKPRITILPPPDRRMGNMDNTKNSLKKIASKFEEEGLIKSSSVVRDAISSLENLKIAQYLGVQGYWIRNRRCWDNCYRTKRSSNPEVPAQEVWMQCWEEYKKSINNPKSGWEKYAQENKEKIKLTLAQRKEWDNLFANIVEDRIKRGMSTPEAVYATIEEESQRFIDKVTEDSANLMVLAESLKEAGREEEGKKLATLAMDMLKESQFTNFMGNVVDFFRTRGGQIGARLKRTMKAIQNYRTNLQTMKNNGKTHLIGGNAQAYTGLSDNLGKEMAVLTQLKMKYPNIISAIQPAIESIATFMRSSTQNYINNGRKYNIDDSIRDLTNLLNGLAGSNSMMEQAAQTGQLPENQTGQFQTSQEQNKEESMSAENFINLLKSDANELTQTFYAMLQNNILSMENINNIQNAINRIQQVVSGQPQAQTGSSPLNAPF